MKCKSRCGIIIMLTWHIWEHEDALVKTKREKVPPQLLEDGHAHTEGEATHTHQHRVPQVVDLGQRENIYKNTQNKKVN